MNKNQYDREIMNEADIKDAILQLKFSIKHEEWNTVQDVIEYLQEFLSTDDLEDDCCEE